MPQANSTLNPIPATALDSAVAVLTGIVKTLVTWPAYVRVLTQPRDAGVVLILEVKAEDIEHVTGRNCRTLTSLKTIVSVISAQTNQAISLDIRAARA